MYVQSRIVINNDDIVVMYVLYSIYVMAAY
jgi:hypothetical protein